MTTIKFQITLFSSDKLKDVYNYQVDLGNLTEDSGTTEVPIICNFETNEGIDWRLEFFLKGRHNCFSDYLSILLRQETKEVVEVEWSISAISFSISQNGVKFKASTYKKEALKKQDSLCFIKFLERKDLFNPGNGIWSNDKLTLTGKISIYKSDAEKIKYSDVSLKVERHLIPSHKILLAQCSKFFEDKLSELDEDKKFIKLDGIELEVAKQMSKFIIDGKVEDPELQIFARPLLIAALKFKVKKLQVYCENYLTEKLTVENVVETMEFAIDNSSEELFNKCIIFIGRNCPKIPEINWESHITKYPQNFSRLFQHCVFENFGNVPKNKQYFTGASLINTEDCQCQFSQDFSRLFDRGIFTDVILKVEGQELKVHKLILASRSTVFKRILDSKEKDLKEKQGTTEIEVAFEKFDFATVREMVRYIYSGKVNNMEELAYNLLTAAKKFNLRGLTNLCGEHLQTTLAVENVLQVLYTANKYGCKKLKEKCINYFAREIDEVFKTDSWQKFITMNPKLLSEIFKDWMKNHFVCK